MGDVKNQTKSSKDVVLEMMIKNVKRLGNLTDKTAPFSISKVENIISSLTQIYRNSYLIEYDAMKRKVNAHYVYIFELPFPHEYLNMKKDNTAIISPTYTRDERTGTTTLDAQGFSLWDTGNIYPGEEKAVVGLEIILKGTMKDGKEGALETLDGYPAASRVIANYYNINEFSNKGVILFITGQDKTEGYALDTDYQMKALNTGINYMLDDILNDDSHKKVKGKMLESVKRNSNTVLSKFSIDGRNVHRTYLNKKIKENDDIKALIVRNTRSLLKKGDNYSAKLGTFINGNGVDFYEFVKVYRLVYGKIVGDYITNILAPKIDGEKVRYKVDGKHISYEKDKFIKLMDSLPEESADMVKKGMETKKEDYGGMYA